MQSPSYEELCELEPGLLDLEAEIRAIEDDGSTTFFCSNFVWLPLNAQLKTLLGVARPGDAEGEAACLRKSEAYETAYLHLSRLLPPCRDCGCRTFHGQVDWSSVPRT